jgi:hypothetical protein
MVRNDHRRRNWSCCEESITSDEKMGELCPGYRAEPSQYCISTIKGKRGAKCKKQAMQDVKKQAAMVHDGKQ